MLPIKINHIYSKLFCLQIRNLAQLSNYIKYSARKMQPHGGLFYTWFSKLVYMTFNRF